VAPGEYLLIIFRCGYRVIATSSPDSFDLVRGYGAEAVFDYNAMEVADQIRQHTNNLLKYALDIITEPQSMKDCYSAIGRTGGRYTSLEKYHDSLCTRKAVKPEFIMGMAMLGKDVALADGYESEGNPEWREFGISWYRTVQRLIDEGKLSPHPLRVVPGRWEGILEGLELLRSKSVRAQKLVVRVL